MWTLDTRGRAVREADPRRWAQFMDTDRVLARELWEAEDGQVEVITVFLGFEMFPHNPPVLWSSNALLHREGTEHPELLEEWHHTSRPAALRGHAALVRRLKGSDNYSWQRHFVGPAGVMWPIILGGYKLADMLDGRADGVVNVAHFFRRCAGG